jgi:hypothetical protein
MGGRGLALPPLSSIVAILCLAGGIMIGFEFAPRPAPAAPAGPTLTAAQVTQSTASPASTPASVEPSVSAPRIPTSIALSTPTETPPPDGMTLAEALSDLHMLGLGSPGEVVVARVVQISDQPLLPIAPETPLHEWVWEFVIQGVPDCINSTGPCFETTELIVIDYWTGALVRAVSPAPDL